MIKVPGKFLFLAATATSALLVGPAHAADDAAARFGMRDNVLSVSISPDGKSLIVVQPDGPRGAIAWVTRPDTETAPELKGILTSTGNPERLTDCRWASDTRVVCTLFMIDSVLGDKMAATRMISLNADGSDAKLLSARSTGRSLGLALGGGSVIDWLSDANADGGVLMTRWFVPQETTSNLTGRTGQGLGVERVNPRTLARRTVEQGNPIASGYITDGRGNVRIMAIAPNNSLGQSKDRYDFRYRKKNSREWLPLATTTFSNYQAHGFMPVAVDPDLDVVYGRESVDGRIGLYKIALDGSLKKDLVFAGPDNSYGIDDVIEIGRKARVIGVSWITDKRKTAIFDPALKQFAAALSRALPDAPNVSIVDASADEQRLVIFAGSDRDPGRFFLYDKATKKLGEILPARPLLDQIKLAEMKPISYPASDGKMIPAYLTLPPGSSGKGLPAIVLPHGGPTYRDEWNFDWLPQFFANRGYAVIQPQFRGSSGYGTDFFNNNAIRSWKLAISDVNDAGRWLVKQGIADASKLGIVGWSYGGYAALQSQVVDPTLFKAVVAIAPVTDFGLMRDESERAGGSTKESLDAVFGDSQTAESGSPARHIEQFAAPVMMFMGDIDQNVPVSQARLMESRLKSAGKKVQYFEYKGLDHQLDDSMVRSEMLSKADRFLRETMKM